MNLLQELAGFALSIGLDAATASTLYSAYWKRGSISPRGKALLFAAMAVFMGMGLFFQTQPMYILSTYSIVFLLSFFYKVKGLWRLLGLSFIIAAQAAIANAGK